MEWGIRRRGTMVSTFYVLLSLHFESVTYGRITRQFFRYFLSPSR